MNARTLLSFGLLTMAPSLLPAQTLPEPPVPAIAPVPSTPGVARAPRVPSAPRPAVAVAPEASMRNNPAVDWVVTNLTEPTGKIFINLPKTGVIVMKKK